MACRWMVGGRHHTHIEAHMEHTLIPYLRNTCQDIRLNPYDIPVAVHLPEEGIEVLTPVHALVVLCLCVFVRIGGFGNIRSELLLFS